MNIEAVGELFEALNDAGIRMDFELPQGKRVYYLAPCIGT